MYVYLDRIKQYLVTLGEDAYDIWLKGGWAMIALAFVALVMFWVGMRIWMRLGETQSDSVPEETWRRWVTRPGQRFGSIGRLLDFANAGNNESVKDAVRRFHELRIRECQPFLRDLKVMRVCVSAAPLVGLLGTVTGMLATFDALSTGAGGDQTLDKIAKGISEALITTETGLVIALPGLFFQYILSRRLNRYQAFLTHLETVCLQNLHRRLAQKQALALKEAAKREISRRLSSELRAQSQGLAATAAVYPVSTNSVLPGEPAHPASS